HRETGIAKVRVIGEIEKLRPELQPMSFVQRERLIDCEIPIESARPKEGAVAQIARSKRRRSGESRCVEPEVDVPIRQVLGAAEIVGTRIPLAGVDRIPRYIDRERPTALPRKYAGDIPATQNAVRDAARHEEVPAFAEGKFVNQVRSETLAKVVGWISLLAGMQARRVLRIRTPFVASGSGHVGQ